MLADHVEHGREVTVACIEVARQDATAFGVMAVDADDLITHFVEKPQDPPTIPGKPDRSLASMGVYIFNTDYLLRELARDAADPRSSHDFGKDIIPHAVREGRAFAHRFEQVRILATALAFALLPEWFGSELTAGLRVALVGALLASLAWLPPVRQPFRPSP